MLIEMLIVFACTGLLTLICGAAGLPVLKKLHVGQRVRDDGPASHLKKTGTPTFGGFFFLIPIFLLGVLALLWGGSLQPLAVLVLLTLLFGLVGFIDDYIKVRIDKKGLSVRQKSALLFVLTFLFVGYYLYLSPQDPFLLVPVSGHMIVISGWWKLLYGVFAVLYLFFVCNAVNITDGVDGLSSSVTVVSSVYLAASCLLLDGTAAAARPSGWLAAAMAAGCLAFLVFNRHPARVIMGDTGSQALGAAFAGITLLLGMPWLLLLTGFVYLAEAMSVVIQVSYFKYTHGKRIFRMSPIHHHFELSGWPENKVVIIFSLAGLISGAAGLLLTLWA